VPPIDYVENTAGYANEIRFYHDAGNAAAQKIQKELYNLTGITFQLKNIKLPSAKGNNFEVWYNNSNAISSKDTIKLRSYERVAFYENIWFKPGYIQNFPQYDMYLSLDSLDAKHNIAIISANRISDDKELVAKGILPGGSMEVNYNNFRCVVFFRGTGNVRSIPIVRSKQAAFIDVYIFKKGS